MLFSNVVMMLFEQVRYISITNNKTALCFYISDTVHFDNTYSWMRSKQISYLVEVLEPSAAIKRVEATKEQHKSDV